MENLFEKEIIALVPQYVDSRGNCTILHRKDSKPLVLEKTIKTTIKSIGKHYMIDLDAMKNRYKSLLASRNLLPIALSKTNILVPFKTRIPMYKNDGAFSYINMKYIRKVKVKNRSTIVVLENDFEIESLSTIKTVNKHMKNGKIISKCYEDRPGKIREEEEVYNKFIPASKADIYMLKKKLEEIEKRYNYTR